MQIAYRIWDNERKYLCSRNAATFRIQNLNDYGRRRSDGRSEQSRLPDGPRTHMTAAAAVQAVQPQRLLSTRRWRRQSSVCDAHEILYAHARSHAHPRSAGRRDVRCPSFAFENDQRRYLRACVEIPARRSGGVARPGWTTTVEVS